MLHEAELFVMAEVMLVEVLGRARAQDAGIVLPAMFPGAEQPQTLAEAVAQYLRDDAQLAEGLRDAAVPRGDGTAPDGAPRSSPVAPSPSPVGPLGPVGLDGPVAAASRAACAAAAQVVDGDAVVLLGDERLPASRLLLRVTVARKLLAHNLAAHLSSTACPLPEELARPLHALTGPDAATWRSLGWFRAPMPMPDHVSQRDRFLLSAGHEPHPVAH